MKTPLRFFLSAVLFFLFSHDIYAQSVALNPDFYTITKNGKSLMFPLLGGLNSPRVQFGDINGDQKKDMLILSQGELMIFLRTTDSEFQFFSADYTEHHIKNWFVLGDLNNDGFADVLTDNELNQVQSITNNKKSGQWFDDPASPVLTTGGQQVTSESLSQPTLFDADKNGTLDFFSGLSTGTIVHFNNSGTAETPAWTFETDHYGKISVLLDTVLTRSVGKSNLHGASAVQLHDFNQDGFTDIFFGDFFSAGIYYFQNSGIADSVVFDYVTNAFPTTANLQTIGFNQVNFLDFDQRKNDLFVTVNFSTADKSNFYQFKNVSVTEIPSYQFETNTFIDMPDIGSRSHTVRLDVNKDGQRDLLLTGESGKISSYIFQNAKTFVWQNDSWGNITAQNNLAPTVVDINGDQRPDIVHGMFDGKLRCYIQLSGGSFQEQNSFILTDQPNNDFGSYSVPAFYDWDSDGDNDMAVGNASGTIVLVENSGTPQLPVWTKQSEFKTVGGYASPFFYDWNSDGRTDLTAGNESGSFLVFFRTETADNFLFSEVPDVILQTGVRGLSPAEISESSNNYTILAGCNRGGLVMLSVKKETGIPVTDELLIYPNPSFESVTLHSGQLLNTVSVYNVLGQKVLKFSVSDVSLTFSVRHLSSGVYFVQSEGKGKIRQTRFTVIH